MKFLRSLIPGWLICAVRDHHWTLAQIVGTKAVVKWCHVCDRVEWID